MENKVIIIIIIIITCNCNSMSNDVIIWVSAIYFLLTRYLQWTNDIRYKNMVRPNIIFCLTNIYLWYTWAIKCVTNNYYTRTIRLITVSHSHFKHGQIEVKKIWNNGNLFRLLIRIFNVTGLTLHKKTVWRMSSTK